MIQHILMSKHVTWNCVRNIWKNELAKVLLWELLWANSHKIINIQVKIEEFYF